MPNAVSGRVVNTRTLSSGRAATGMSNSAPSLRPIQLCCIVMTRSGQPGSRSHQSSASLALASESACLPLSCRVCASFSLATAPFTFGSFWSIFAAASRPSLITFGHELASAAPFVSARLTATAVTVRNFLIRNSPPRDTGEFYQHSTADRLLRFPRGRFRRVDIRGGRRMEVVVNPLGHLRRHLRHGGELGHRRLTHAARRPQRLEQARADGGPDAGNRVERGLNRALPAQLLVIRDREPVRLVPDLLQRVQRGRRRVEQQRLATVARVDLLLLLGERDDGDPVEPEILQNLKAHVELAAAAVDEDEVGQHASLLERLAEPPAEHLAQRAEVVGAAHRADLESLVVVLLHRAVFPDHERADLLGALDVGDVVALDAVRRAGQIERARQLLLHELLAVSAWEQEVLQGDG